MSETRAMNDKLKNAQEVTSLASTDHLLVADANGNLKGFKNEAIPLFRHYTAGDVFYNKWVRIGACSMLLVGTFYITNFYNNDPSKGCIFNTVGSHILPFTPQIVPIISSPWYPKLRFVYNASVNTYYLDIFVTMSGRNNIIVTFSGYGFTLSDSLQEATVPSGWSSKEFSLTSTITSADTISGGGKLLSFNELRNTKERRVA